jgi:DNA polymerase alpha subunit A
LDGILEDIGKPSTSLRPLSSLPNNSRTAPRSSANGHGQRRPLISHTTPHEQTPSHNGTAFDYGETDFGDGEDDLREQSINYTQSNLVENQSISRVADEEPPVTLPSEGKALEAKPKISLTQTTKKFKVSTSAQSDSSIPLLKPVVDFYSDMSAGGGERREGLGGGDGEVQSAPASSSIDPTWWLHTYSAPAGKSENSAADMMPPERPEGEEYVPMYWTDATETSGVIYLFGRIAITEPGAPKRFVSCCVAVHGCERNLFVLPKRLEGQKSDGTPLRANMADVYKDLSALLVPRIIPRSEGRGFRCKPVRRKYAFDMPDVPREETDYMKVVYSARHPSPSYSQCNAPGNSTPSIEKIFGGNINALEWFLLKRKIMGPGWLLIRKPQILPTSVSWCKVEIAVDDPKNIEKIPTGDAPPAPPLTTMSISMKTAVNPSTHVHEVIALSAFIHVKVDVDGDTALAPNLMKRYTFVRQLGQSCGPSYPNSFPHDLTAELSHHAADMITSLPNERALLNAFFTRIHVEDPDILASHNLFGFEFDVVISRAVAHKLPGWNKIGRLRRTKTPTGISDRDVASGRLLCDTYKAAKEFLRETTYSLTHLAGSQLQLDRAEVDPMDVPRYFSDAKNIIKLCMHTMNDAYIVLRLMLKLQVVPLTKQLTNLSGNLWARTMRGARAERIEYLLLHEFHMLKYILPERKPMDSGASKKAPKRAEDDQEGDDEGQRVGGHARARAKAAYAGGLVLEPKKGLYDTYVLLLDFNSLYPSLIQEYNLCFTTIEWTKFDNDKSLAEQQADAAKAAEDAEADEVDPDAVSAGMKALPPLPDSTLPQGVLPRVIKTLVDRRREVKALLKKAKDPSLRQQLDIRQKALKLTANSMYGCLGFSFSRFYAKPIAALVTSKGREALQRTVDQARNQMGLDVIYGDTDSVMINTGMTDLAQVKVIGQQVKKEVNKLYKCLELDIDGIFKSMLLLKKKKYAALVINESADGTLTYEKELKGLDLVRRDWCPLSKNAGKFTVDKILSGAPREDIVIAIHDYLGSLSQSVRAGQVEMTEFIVTKGLNKSPKDYPDVKGQPHLQVALQMLKANKPVNIGDHIPYIICTQVRDAEKEGNSAKTSAADRAYHPDELVRSKGELTIDYEWYLSQQILPPISRLCEPIEGTSQAIISQQLGLDATR